jgi:hypothetical protein
MAGINQGEKLKFRVGEHVCPHGLGTPHDCNHVARLGSGTQLTCDFQFQEVEHEPCPFNPTLILLKDIADQQHSPETANLPPLD